MARSQQREQEADRRMEHWHRAYNGLNQEYLASKDRDLCPCCQQDKDETKAGQTVELCRDCSTGRETRKSLELKLDKVYQDLRYWQECCETLLSERDRKKYKKNQFITRNPSYPAPIFFSSFFCLRTMRLYQSLS